MRWTILFLDALAQAEVDALHVDMRARFQRIAELIESFGLEKVREPYVKHIEGKLWEIRLKGRAGIARSLYVTASGRRVIVVRTFVKKTEKTPRFEIELALKRAEVIR